MGEQVVLVDSNVRTPSQHLAFQTDISEGLCDVLRGAAALTSAVKPEVAPGLSLLTSGRSTVPPPQLITMSAVQGIAMALTSLYDWVIIDGPPVTTYPESASLASASGGALLVIRAEQTRHEVAEEAKRVLEDSGVEVLGAVLNRRKYHIPDFIYRRL
jgi:Mrp family chromosome partitioning ATPase